MYANKIEVIDLKRSHTESSDGAAKDVLTTQPEPPLKKIQKEMSVQQEIIRSINDAFTSNRFDILTDDITDHDLSTAGTSAAGHVGAAKRTPRAAANQNRIPKVHIPPIVFKDIKFAQLKGLLNNLNISEYITQFMSIGIKITVNDIDNYYKLNNFVTHKDNKDVYNTYTHNVQHKTPVKIVLSGMPLIDTEELKQEIDQLIATKNLKCETVQLMKTKRNKYDEYALYLFNFTRLNFDFNALKTITGVFNVRVRWSSYKRRSGPTQCSNCQIFGHGNNNCNLPTVCSLCGEGHHQTECIHLGPYEEGIYAEIKCSNCNGNHAANSLQCPRREEFRNMRETLSRKANNHQKRAANHINHEDHNAYPELRQPRQPSIDIL